MNRHDGRAADEIRSLRVTKDYVKHPAGSCLMECGDTRVLCTASIEEKVPPFLMHTGTGWVTAEYGMLPGSCSQRIQRDKNAKSGRTLEIQRLIGRSLRSVVDLTKLGERTVKIDCDVIQADGGTRTTSITGGFIALCLAIHKLYDQGVIKDFPVQHYICAISVGIFNDEMIADLDYQEDSKAQMDMNVVMLNNGAFGEVQGTAEGKPFKRKELDQLLDLAQQSSQKLFDIQKKNLGSIDRLIK
ncbi:MAG: ribonuclease PH [Candidatus Omnitrophica bacterium]|nr:ribonuclease PH [Candidatus Omnitrophota bacterium]